MSTFTIINNIALTVYLIRTFLRNPNKCMLMCNFYILTKLICLLYDAYMCEAIISTVVSFCG